MPKGKGEYRSPMTTMFENTSDSHEEYDYEKRIIDGIGAGKHARRTR